MAEVQVIPPKAARPDTLRVAAYCRVSSDSADQLHSYAAQIRAYTQAINAHDGWDLVDIYADEGITGTSLEKRDEFRRMLSDCRAGKITRILVKSVSRFARNTLELIETTRELKDLGVVVVFEEQGIDTAQMLGEMQLTLLAMAAQEESTSISKNMRWSYQKRMENGTFLGCTAPYGYTLEDGKLSIIPEEATVVQNVFAMRLAGSGQETIAKTLNQQGVPTREGTPWYVSKIHYILTNEKYKGDALLQKSYTVDFLTKKQKVNEGEVPQYYVTNSHPAIIEPELFDLVQYELKTRKTDGRFTSCLHPFSGRIICGECGGIYGSKVWHSNTENRSLVWQCNEKYRGQHCSTPHLTEGEIKAAFLAAFNIVLGNRDEIIEAYEEVIAALTDTADLDAEQETLENESEVVLGLIQKIISENAQTAMDQEEYNRRYDAYSERFEAARKRLAEIAELRQERNAKKTRIRLFMENMNNHQELVQSFDEELWYSTVDYVTVYEDKRLVFTFRDGRQVEITAELWRAA